MNIRERAQGTVADGPAACHADTPGAGPELTTDTDPGTRDRVLRLLVQGPATARDLSEQLGLSAAGVRRHLDSLEEAGSVSGLDPVLTGPRGRGRPARRYALTESGRSGFPHAYDDLAVNALRFLRDTAGPTAVAAFARSQVSGLEARLAGAVAARPLDDRATVIAETLTGDGYAALSSDSPSGVQVCQHHCPVAHVAEEFPQLCEAETEALSRVLGTHVQRLATIAHGDGVCTTHVPRRQAAEPRAPEVRAPQARAPGKSLPPPPVVPGTHPHSPSTHPTPSARTSP